MSRGAMQRITPRKVARNAATGHDDAGVGNPT
jgi:hypothetical protein